MSFHEVYYKPGSKTKTEENEVVDGTIHRDDSQQEPDHAAMSLIDI